MLETIIATKWSESHGARERFLGAGALYYGLVYALAARRCVCLGSGGGFVPMVMVEAQRQLITDGMVGAVDVTLVDADIGPWGRPVYGPEGIPGWPEIKLLVQLTHEAASEFAEIDYLHVDADHSYEGVLADLNDYGPRMHGTRWAITVHDTCNRAPGIGAYQAAYAWASLHGHDLVTFHWGAGVTLLAPHKGLW